MPLSPNTCIVLYYLFPSDVFPNFLAPWLLLESYGRQHLYRVVYSHWWKVANLPPQIHHLYKFYIGIQLIHAIWQSPSVPRPSLSWPLWAASLRCPGKNWSGWSLMVWGASLVRSCLLGCACRLHSKLSANKERTEAGWCCHQAGPELIQLVCPWLWIQGSVPDCKICHQVREFEYLHVYVFSIMFLIIHADITTYSFDYAA